MSGQPRQDLLEPQVLNRPRAKKLRLVCTTSAPTFSGLPSEGK